MVFVLFVVVFLSFLLLWSLSRIWMCVYFHILTSSQCRARAITPSVVSPLTYTHFSTLFSHVMWCRLFWLCFFLYWLDSVGYKIQCIAWCCCFVCIYWLILLFLYWFHDVCVCVRWCLRLIYSIRFVIEQAWMETCEYRWLMWSVGGGDDDNGVIIIVIKITRLSGTTQNIYIYTHALKEIFDWFFNWSGTFVKIYLCIFSSQIAYEKKRNFTNICLL